MRILLLNQTFYPDFMATSQQLTDLAQFLVSKGHSVSVICDRRGYQDRDKIFLKNEVYKGIEIHRVNSTRFGKGRVRYRLFDSLTFDLSLVWKLLTIPKHDIVISYTSPPLIGVIGAIYCLFKGSKSFQWLMDINPDAAFAVGYIRRKSLIGRFLNRVFEWSLSISDRVIVLDRWMKKCVESHGVPSERISVVPPWSVLKPDDGESQTQIDAFKKKHGLEGKFVVLYSGNHSIAHPLDTILGIAYRMRENKNLAFLFIGSGGRVQDVKEFKESHQLDNIFQLPWQPREDLAASFGSADLHVVVLGNGVQSLVHTSKIYTILSTGKPFLFIGPRKSHVVDTLNECPVGYPIEHGDLEGGVKIVEDVMKLGPETLQNFRHLGTEYVVSRFRPEPILEGFLAEIEEATSELKDSSPAVNKGLAPS